MWLYNHNIICFDCQPSACDRLRARIGGASEGRRRCGAKAGGVAAAPRAFGMREVLIGAVAFAAALCVAPAACAPAATSSPDASATAAPTGPDFPRVPLEGGVLV